MPAKQMTYHVSVWIDIQQWSVVAEWQKSTVRGKKPLERPWACVSSC